MQNLGGASVLYVSDESLIDVGNDSGRNSLTVLVPVLTILCAASVVIALALVRGEQRAEGWGTGGVPLHGGGAGSS